MRIFRITIRLNENVLATHECVANTLHAAKQAASRFFLEQAQHTSDLRGGYQANWEDTADHESQKTWHNQYALCQIHIKEEED